MSSYGGVATHFLAQVGTKRTEKDINTDVLLVQDRRKR